MIPSRRALTLACGALVFALTAAPAVAQDAGAKVDRGLRESLRRGGATQHVIITVQPGHRADIRQALEQHGDRIKSEHPFVDALAADIHADDVRELAGHPWVRAVSLDAEVHAGAAAGVPASPRSDALAAGSVSGSLPDAVGSVRQTLGLPRVAGPFTPSGAGVTVAVIDSGISPIADFAGRITAFYDFTRGGIPAAPQDDYGHGTHVAGLIGSSGLLSDNQFQGVAPGVNLVGLKVLDKNGVGRTSDVIRALEYVTTNRDRLHVQIVNLSLGHPIYAPAKDDPLVQAVERASAAGLIVVVSAGNAGQNEKTGAEGYTGLTSPGNAPSCITIGAAITRDTVTRDDDVVAPYSSRGPSWYDGFAKPDAVAPGHALASDTTTSSTLYTTLPALRKSARNGKAFLLLSGSSMAAAVTSGVVAVLVDAHNRAGYEGARPLTANVVKAMLEFSALPLRDADYLTQGAGEINAGGAVALASAIDTSAPEGTWWARTGVPPHSMIGAQLYDWGQTVVWGDRALTGNLIYSSLEAWSASAAWGGATSWNANVAQVKADNIVWGTAKAWTASLVRDDRVIGQRPAGPAAASGDNIVWGTADGDNIVWGTRAGDNIVWGTAEGDNIVWGTSDGDNIVWGTTHNDNIVWGTAAGDNIVWGTSQGDNIVWGAPAPGTKPGGDL